MVGIIAININDQMPKYAFRFLKKEYRSLANCNVLLLGVSYRGEVGDTRNTPVANLHDYLIKDGAFVTCHDPFIENWVQKSISINTDLSKLLTNNIDIIIISTGHYMYKNQNTIDMILKLNLKLHIQHPLQNYRHLRTNIQYYYFFAFFLLWLNLKT